MTDTQATRTPLSASVHDATTNNNRLGLTLYLIPGFPNRKDYEELFNYCDEHPRVSVIETALPVSGGFADYQNAMIRKAHATGMESFPEGIVPVELLKGKKPTFGVIYGESVQKYGLDGVFDKHPGAFDGIALEQGTGDFIENLKIGEKYGIEMLRSVAVQDMEKGDLQWLVRVSSPGGYMYLVTAAATGGTLATNEEIALRVDWIKEAMPAATASAGFGIKTADDIRRMAKIPQLDGVILGTTFLAAMDKSLAAAKEYLSEMTEALTRPA